MADMLDVRVNSPDKVLWEGQALSVTSENAEGPFDILPFHTNFISIIEKKPILIKTPDGVKEHMFDHSVIYATKNKVNIYTDI